MKSIAKFLGPVLGLGIACLACCAVPLLGTGLAGLGLAGLGVAWLDWRLGLLPLAIAAVGLVALRLATRHASTCKSPLCTGGCKTSCAVPGAKP